MLSFIILFTVLLGLSSWVPRPADGFWFGFAFFQGGMLLIIALYAGDVLLSVPLSAMVGVLGTVAGLGVVRALVRARAIRARLVEGLIHPVCLLSLLVLAIATSQGGVEYLPMPGDETASWLRLTRQIFLADHYWSKQIVYHHGAYTNGWPLLLAFANSVRGFWDDGHAALVPFLLHVGLLGLVFDLLRHATLAASWKSLDSYIFAWLGMLSLLAVQASWVLVPHFQLIDEPLTYAFIGIFLMLFIALDETAMMRIIIPCIGVAICAGYLLKISMLAVVPAVALILLAIAWADDRRWHTIACYALWAGVPLAIAVVSWGQLKTGEECNASPLRLLSESGIPTADRLHFVTNLFVPSFMSYVPHFKLPATLVSGACLLSGLFHRRLRWIVIAFAVFAIFYTAALYLAYVSCLDIIDGVELQSFQRYMLVPLRLLHVLGPVVLAIWAVKRPGLGSLMKRAFQMRVVTATACSVALLLLGYQGWMAERSLKDLSTRRYESPILRDAILAMKRESAALLTVLAKSKVADAQVSLVDQGGWGVYSDLASYFGLKTHRDGGPLAFYVVVPPYSWKASTEPERRATEEAQLERSWRGVDVIWPVNLDDLTRASLKRLADTAVCADHLESYFFVRSISKEFVCVPKESDQPG